MCETSPASTTATTLGSRTLGRRCTTTKGGTEPITTPLHGAPDAPRSLHDIDDNTAPPRSDDIITDPAVLAQLRQAALDEPELQIIAFTIEVKAAAPAWWLQQGVILYNERYYISATSPLLQDLLESLGTTTPHLLVVSLHIAASAPTTQAFPSSIMLIEDWPHRILSSATVSFFDSNGRQFLTIEDTYINRQHTHGHMLISPSDYDTGDLLFGTLEHLTTTPRPRSRKHCVGAS